MATAAHFYVGSFDLSATGSGQTITIPGFADAPKLLQFWTTRQVTDGSAVASALMGFGAYDGTTQAATAFADQDAQPNTLVDRYSSNDSAIIAIVGSTIQLRAQVTATGTSGGDGTFTLNVLTLTGGNAKIFYIAYGGDEFEGKVVPFTTPATDGTQALAHGLSGAPTALFGAGTGLPTSVGSPPIGGTNGILCIGMSDITTSRAVNIGAQNGQIDSNTLTQTRNGLFSFYYVSGDLGLGVMSSVDATNVNITWTGLNNARYSFMIAMRGVRAHLKTFTLPTSGSSFSVTGYDFQPSLMLFSSPMTSSTGLQDHAKIMFGATDGTRNVVAGVTSEDAQPDTDADRFIDADDCIQIYDFTRTLKCAAEVTAFTSDGATFSSPTLDGTAYHIAGLALAPLAGGDTTPEDTDTISLSISESESLVVQLSDTDAISLSLSEAEALAVALSDTDSATLSLSAAESISAALSDSDTATVSVSEAEAISVPISASDTISVSFNETESVDIGDAIVEDSDTLALSVTETESVTVQVSDSDIISLSLSETVSNAAVLSDSDSIQISLSEIESIMAALADSANANLSLSENEDIEIFISVSDSDTISLSLSAAETLTETEVELVAVPPARVYNVSAETRQHTPSTQSRVYTVPDNL